MTETPSQEQQEQQTAADGLRTEHLRDYTALRRTTYDRKIAGVAGGLARHLNIDPIIVRVIFVVLIFFGGAGLVLYGAAWLLVPEDDGSRAPIHTSDSTRNTLLIIVAVFAALLIIGDSWGGFGFPWFLGLVLLFVFAYLISRDNRGRHPAAPQPPSQPLDDTTTQTLPIDQPAQYVGDQYGWQPVTAPVVPPKKQKRGPILFGITLALIAAGWGILGIYDSGAGNNVVDAAYPALALATIGAMLVVGAFYGRPGGLVFLGIVAAIALGGSAIADPRYDGDRDLELTPTSAGDLDSSYHVPAGRIELDLRGIREVETLDGRSFHLDANAGELLVILPENVGANIDADIDFGGAIDTPDRSTDGWGQHQSTNVIVPNEQARIDLNLDLKFGHIEVRQP